MRQVSTAQAVGERVRNPALLTSCLRQLSQKISFPASTDTNAVTNTIDREGST